MVIRAMRRATHPLWVVLPPAILPLPPALSGKMSESTTEHGSKASQAKGGRGQVGARARIGTDTLSRSLWVTAPLEAIDDRGWSRATRKVTYRARFIRRNG